MGAIISDCGKYRYVLTRDIKQPVRWNMPCLFVMLNPSKADAELDDRTIRRCIGFAEREGCTSLTVVNLYALRSTDPTKLLIDEDPIGPDNDRHILEQIEKHSVGIIVAAWGSHKKALTRAIQVMSKFNDAYCLGTNKDGQPKHPLYLSKNQPLIDFKRRHKIETKI